MSKIKISEEEFNKLSIEEKIKLLKEENVIPPNMSYADLYKLGRPVPSSFDDEGEPKPIDIDRVYSSENADIVKSRNRKGELLNKGINPNVGIYGGDTNLFAQRLKSIQPKKTEAIDDKEKRPWYEEFIPDETTIPALKKGLWEVPKQITADIPQSVAEAYVLDPYGFSMGDLDLETKDPNHKEYKEAYKFIDEYKKTVNPFIGGEEANELLLNYRSDEYPEGFKNSFWGANGLYTEKSVDETKRIMEESIVSKYTQNLSDWYQDRQDRYGDVSDKWINQLVQTVPQFATQLVVATAAGPGAATAYMSSLMYSDTYQNARPYIKEGELTAMEAHRLSSIVGLVSLATNYGPNYLYSSYKNPTLFKDILFNKMKQKGLYKPYSKEAFKGFLSEGLQESIDEITSLTAEGTYRDISNDEWWDRVLTSGSIGMVLGGGASTTLTYVNNQNIKNEVIPKIVETQNLLLPNIMSTDADGNFTFEVKEEDYSSKEEFDKVKEIVDNPEFKEKLDPFKIAERNKKIEDETGEEIPLNMMIFEELNKNNPNTDDVKIKFNQEIPVSIMSDQELLDKNYDPEDFRVSEIKKGEPEYEEGKRQFKVATLGSNIYNSSGGNIILSEGANQDVYIEEVVETLYKKLTTTNPKLKSEIDKWIKSMGKLLNDNNIGGPRGIELFSKWYTFNYLGYSNTEVFLKDIVALPDNIVKEFDTIMGQQKDGTNVSFLFKGGEPIVTETKTNVEEPSEIIETPDESFRLIPEKGFRVGDKPSQIDNVNMMFGRGTGHFGSGYYFFGEKSDAISLAEKRGFRPITEIDLKGKNLYKVKGKRMTYGKDKDGIQLYTTYDDSVFGLELHEMLRKINDQMYTNEEEYNRFKKTYGYPNVKEVVDRLKNWNDIDVSPELIINSIDAVRSEIENNDGNFNAVKTPTASTRVMKALGYDGIDVRGIEGLDNANYGSVLYEDFSVDNNLSKTPEESFKIVPQPKDAKIQETPIRTYRLEPTNLKKLYHTTLSRNAGKILKEGLFPLQTTLWKTPDGERHGNGEIYVFESLEDAKAWKLKMQLELTENFGGFEVEPSVTIFEIDNKTDMWEEDIDVASGIPKNILGPNSGRWFRRFEKVPPEDIKVLKDDVSFRLTPQQEEFFKDSKIREPNGELTEVFHGTAAEDFEEFDPSAERGEWKVLGDGTYFSRLPQQANNYTRYGDGNPRVIPAYLNLKNPFIIEGQGLRREIDTPTEPTTEEINRFKEEQIKHSGKDLGYWYDNWLRLPNDIKREVLLDLGYDGVMDGSVYVAFKPEQIKSQFNPKPTSDPRISYRLTPQKLSKIDDFLMEVTMEGESARFWYEKSGQALLDIVDNDYDKARKLLAIIAITSPQMKVKGNFGQMIKANYKYVQGMEPEAGRFPKAMAKRIKDVMEGKDFGGIKTNSFLDNLLVQLEEHKRSTDDKPVTVDLWMMRAFGFDKDVPTELEYKQIREAIQKIAKKIGWEPHQVQASIWTSVQARWNLIYNQEKDKSIKAGTLKKVGKKYVWKNKKAESNFRKKIFKLLKTTSLSKQIIEDNNFDYSDALNSFKGVVRTETFPHPSTKIFEGLNPTFEQQLEYDFDIRQLLTDKNGKDKIAKLIGLLEVGKFNAPGFYEGDISPSQQLEVLMSTSDVSINPETKTLLELYASIYGILTKQQAVGITKVFNPKSKKQANVVMVETKGDIPFEQIYKALLDAGYDTGAIPQNYGFNVVNFNKSVDNKKFQNDVESIINKVYENSSETINFELGQSDGLDIDNNWEENPNGESYKQRISKSEQQDVIEQFISSTSDEISKINEDYKQKWSEKTYRLAPQDPDQLTPEMAEELDKQEQLQRDEETLNNTLSNIELNEPSITDKTKDKIESLKKLNAINTIEKFLTPISTLLENIHPKLKRVLREFEFNLMSKSHKRRRIVKDFYDKAKKMSKVDFNKLDILFKNSSMETSQNEINKLLKKYNLQSEYKAIRDMLDEIRQEAIDSGMDIGFLENYIPRIVKNLDKLRTDVFGLDPELQTTYNKLVEEVRKELGRDLKQEEKEHIVDLILRGYRSLDSGKPNPTKQRKVTVVTNEMNKHYVHSSEALMRHIEAMTTDIETRNLLGKNENTTDNINNYIVEIIEDVGLSDEQILQVKEILIARLNPSVTSPLTGLIRNTTYILTMGSYTSALTQVGDLTWALYEGGIFETTRSVLTHFSKNNTKMEEIYFDRIGQEYEEGNFGADAVNTVFKFSGLNRMDRLGKEALINSLLQRFHKDAKKLMEGKDSEKLVADIEAYFDTDDIAKIKKLIEDLAAGILSEDVKLLIFNKVLDYQPMARSEMPLKYIEGDTSRLFFQLKTFSLRQLDVFRKKLITNVKKAKGPKAKAKALYEFSKLLTMFLMAGVSKDVLKDLAMGRDIDDLEDYVKENLFQLVLFSRYQYYKVKEEGALGVAERFIAPPAVSATFRFAKAFYDFITPRELTEKESKLSPYEIRKIREEEREKDLSNLVKWIPILGKHFHWRSDTGRKKDLNVQMKELERKIKKLKIDGKILNKKDRKEYLRVIRDAKDIDMITPAQWENKVDAAYGD